MCSHSPNQTTAQNIAEVLDRHHSYQPGSRQLVNSYVQSDSLAGTGQGKHVAVFEYSDGTVEYSPNNNLGRN